MSIKDPQDETFFEQAYDGMVVTTPAGECLRVNASAHHLLGYPLGALVGRQLLDLIAPRDIPRLDAVIATVLTATGAIDAFTLVRRDGSHVTVELAVQRLADGRVFSVIRDLSHREPYAIAESDDARTSMAHAAHAVEGLERLRKIAAQLPGVAYQFKLRPDGTSCFPYASDRIRDIYRVSPEDVLDDASPVFALIHPDDQAALMASILASSETLKAWQLEYRVQFPGGEVRWLYGNAVPERQSDGAVLWHGFISDTTELRATRASKDELEAQLRQAQKVESIGRLAGGVAHDFNNLLTSVLGFATLAKGKLPLGSPATRDLERVIESAERGAGLTQQLLAFARRRIIKPEIVNLHGVLGRMAPLIRRLFGEHIELVLNTDHTLQPVKIDVGGVEQLVMNLSLNARDAMPNGGSLSISVENVALSDADARAYVPLNAGPHVRLSVADTGTGMPQDVLARVFEPFFTTKPTGRGTGLGLSVCHGIVSQAGGHILARSVVGEGTTIEIFLPCVEEPPPLSPPPIARTSAPRGSETLLVVEDDATILTLISQALSRLGYRVLSAADGQAALDTYGGAVNEIELLITDVIMPRMSGSELAMRLTALRPGLKVLFASGYTEDALGHHGVLDPSVNFIQKPYTPSLLAARVRQILDGPL